MFKNKITDERAETKYFSLDTPTEHSKHAQESSSANLAANIFPEQVETVRVKTNTAELPLNIFYYDW